MKILVAIKRVVDHNVKIRVKSDGSGVDNSNAKMSMNPFDEIALEEAIRLKEAGKADEVVAVTVGGLAAQDVLRTALAMGADRAILIKADTIPEPLSVAKLLAAIARSETPDLMLFGKQAIDDDCNQTGQMTSALLGWSQATFVSHIVLDGDRARATREVDGGLQVIEVTLPSIMTVDLRLNEPRYASLPNIMKAKKKPLEEMNSADLGIDIAPRLRVIATEEPSGRKSGITLSGMSELIDKLKVEAGVL
ncbi:electron transfer flavoprotein subunit beta/FixA family protein [Novosphingobium flavum]|uniref:Electron transfer flavoprotein subunit beta n=1 Tax=Novosphingobium aerophilum TaxID=2839843 RepID=A0A7X1KCZ2_9SPHN|nr:electron transfer flavoprotein subunit beta/FixA family protein [Novosphingobium aerophilum]MBC2652773.1 electron transfer flavoprotein subunit beta/FixA family protein [Novosphingobium aerophilum]MBC2660836.1 electron transfer flavoprotein subunit beta/FixA family protein [Novosphingobium aerophilum]